MQLELSKDSLMGCVMRLQLVHVSPPSNIRRFR
jgi:hypothetical protein